MVTTCNCLCKKPLICIYFWFKVFKEGVKACSGTGPLRGINTCGGRVFGRSQGYELYESVTEHLFSIHFI